MKLLSRSSLAIAKRPIKILQIGAGNFSRAFTAFALQCLNNQGFCNTGIVIATSSSEKGASLNSQNGLYTVIEASKEERLSTLIDIVQEQFSIPDNFDKFLSYASQLDVNLITSNTTEVGITYKEEPFSHKVESYPARLAVWFDARHRALKTQNRESEDLFILPCELLENNGSLLKEYVLKHIQHWNLPQELTHWIETKVKFLNTLVDRIVPGFPHQYISELQKEWGYEDRFAVLAEKFFFLAIEGDTSSLDKVYPFSKIPLDIIYTDNLEFYRLRKICFLNGAHTALLGLSLLASFTTVQETLKNPQASAFLKAYLEEACIALDGSKETRKFIDDVTVRFNNPYLAHKWEDILLNASSKFALRNVPVMTAQEKKGLSTDKGLKALASIVVLYLKGVQKDVHYPHFQSLARQCPDSLSLSHAFLSDKTFFPMELPIKKWVPRLAFFINTLSSSPEDSFIL